MASYKKKPLSFSKLADKLLARGLVAKKSELQSVLSTISYYRLSGYLYPFRILPGENFKEGTNLLTVLEYYNFDKELRCLIFRYLELIEVKFKNQVMHQHVHRYGPNGYTDQRTLPLLDNKEHSYFLAKIHEDYSSSRAKFVSHFKKEYGNENEFPLWMACEIMSFGNLVRLYRGLEGNMQNSIASHYGISDRVLRSWLLSLHYVRNSCAHHNRLWNRILRISPMTPRENKHPQWHNPVKITPNEGRVRIFTILTIIQYLLCTIIPGNNFKKDFSDLLENYSELPLDSIGLPEKWLSCPIWL